MLIAHAPISYLVNELIQKENIKTLEKNEKILIAVFALLFGILPDFDLFLLQLLKLPPFIHHDIISHTPILYIGIWLLLRLLTPLFTKYISKQIWDIFTLTFLISTLTHLLADVLVTDIMLLYPFSSEKFYIFKYIFEPNLFGGYLLSPLFGIELVGISLVAIFLVRKYLKSKLLNILSLLFVIVSIIFISITIFAHTQTYNRSYLYDMNGKWNYDIDYDRIADYWDERVGNTERDNLESVSKSMILNEANTLLQSQKWSKYSSRYIEDILKQYFGGFDTYRVISQIFYNLHYPLEPVLYGYYIKSNDIKEYASNENSLDLLYDLLSSREMLADMGIQNTSEEGSLVFFLRDETVLNAGILLTNNTVLTVLEEDEKITIHSLESVTNYYKNFNRILIQR